MQVQSQALDCVPERGRRKKCCCSEYSIVSGDWTKKHGHDPFEVLGSFLLDSFLINIGDGCVSFHIVEIGAVYTFNVSEALSLKLPIFSNIVIIKRLSFRPIGFMAFGWPPLS